MYPVAKMKKLMYLYQLIYCFIDLGDERCRVIISIMVLCDANAIIEYDRRRSGLPSAV